MNKIYLIIKRIMDIIISIIGLIFLIPLILIIKIITILSGDFNTIFYAQERIGQYGKVFKMYKFRSMVMDADEKLDEILKNDKKLYLEYKKNKKLSKDPRVTKLGRILRKTNIDELPQLLNVLIGNMSLVGCRPYLPREKEDMGKYYDKIILSKPGITGVWQTCSNKDRSFKYRLKLESEYYKTICFILDTKVFFKTFGVIFKGL